MHPGQQYEIPSQFLIIDLNTFLNSFLYGITVFQIFDP